MFHTGFLLASLFWGSVGVGYCIYGKRQQSMSAWGGGMLMVLASYFVGSAFVMSSVCAVIGTAVYLAIKNGY
jgi:hypothetical protein